MISVRQQETTGASINVRSSNVFSQFYFLDVCMKTLCVISTWNLEAVGRQVDKEHAYASYDIKHTEKAERHFK